MQRVASISHQTNHWLKHMTILIDAARGKRLSRDLQRFLWTRFLGTLANQMMLVALGWQMYDLTGSAWDLGLVGLYQFLPALLLTVPAGYLVDKVDRRSVLAASLALQAVVGFGLAWASGSGGVQRELILALSVALGVARALQLPSQQAMLPSMAPLDQLPRLLAQNSAVIKMAVIGGPALGGFIYATGAPMLYGVCTVLLVLSVGFVASIRPAARSTGSGMMTMATLFAGFGFIWRHKIVLGAMSLDLFAVILGGATALLPIFAKDILHTGPWGLGLLRSAPAVGGLAMAVLMARVPIERHVGRRMFVAVAIYGLATLVFSLSTVFLLSFVALVVCGGADTISTVLRQSLIQLETHDGMRGRVSAVNATFVGASNQLGEFRAGATAQWLGAVGAVVVGASGTLLVVALWMRLFPALAKRDRMRS